MVDTDGKGNVFVLGGCVEEEEGWSWLCGLLLLVVEERASGRVLRLTEATTGCPPTSSCPLPSPCPDAGPSPCPWWAYGFTTGENGDLGWSWGDGGVCVRGIEMEMGEGVEVCGG